MAALLRHGAKRIGRAVLQRTQAAVQSPAVAEERRRLVTRRMYSTDEQANEEITLKIKQKKEELYDLTCKAEQSFRTSSFDNKRLLQLLSVQVKPKQKDYKWHLLRVSKWAINVVEIAGLVALTSLIASGVLRFKRFLGNSKMVRAMMIERNHEAIEAETRSGRIENNLDARKSED